MAKREIIWSSNAQREFADVLEFYSERNQNSYYSFKLIDTLESMTNLVNEKVKLVKRIPKTLFFKVH